MAVAQDISRIDEATFKTDPITTGNEVLHKFGIWQQGNAKFIEVDPKIYQNFFGNDYENVTARRLFAFNIGSFVTHGLGIKYVAGAADDSNITNNDVGGGYYTHAVTRRAVGKAPFYYTMRSKRNAPGGLINYTHNNGCVTQLYSFRYNNTNDEGICTQNEAGYGIKASTVAANPTPVYPNSDSDYFKADSNLIATYDVTGDAHNIASRLLEFQVNFANNITPISDISQSTLFYDRYTFGNRQVVGGNMKVLKRDNDYIYEDWNDDLLNDRETKWAIDTRFHKNTNEYINFDLNSVLITNIREAVVDIDGDDLPYWDINYTVDDFTVTTKDTLNTAGYWGEV